MHRLRLRDLLDQTDALTTVEFVALFPAILIVLFFVLEIGLALFWWETVQEASQTGARLALVSNAAVPSMTTNDCPATGGQLPLINCKNANFNYGDRCSTGACASYDLTCAAGTTGCDTNNFPRILSRVQAIFGWISASNVSIRY